MLQVSGMCRRPSRRCYVCVCVVHAASLLVCNSSDSFCVCNQGKAAVMLSTAYVLRRAVLCCVVFFCAACLPC